MATAASTSYMPVDQESNSPAAAEPILQQPLAHKQEEAKKKDPLYAAMFGTQIGSAPVSQTKLDTVGVDTLDEPVIDTLKRDLNNIVEKAKVILMMKAPPAESVNDWELWGPLLMCLGMAITLGISSNQSGYIFTLVFTLVWMGSLMVTANARLLGYKISFFQNVCLMGYGLFPLMVASTLNMLLPLFWILKVALASISLGWSTAATVRTLNDESLADRKLLASFPIGLFYFIFAWLIIVV